MAPQVGRWDQQQGPGFQQAHGHGGHQDLRIGAGGQPAVQWRHDQGQQAGIFHRQANGPRAGARATGREAIADHRQQGHQAYPPATEEAGAGQDGPPGIGDHPRQEFDRGGEGVETDQGEQGRLGGLVEEGAVPFGDMGVNEAIKDEDNQDLTGKGGHIEEERGQACMPSSG